MLELLGGGLVVAAELLDLDHFGDQVGGVLLEEAVGVLVHAGLVVGVEVHRLGGLRRELFYLKISKVGITSSLAYCYANASAAALASAASCSVVSS